MTQMIRRSSASLLVANPAATVHGLNQITESLRPHGRGLQH